MVFIMTLLFVINNIVIDYKEKQDEIKFAFFFYTRRTGFFPRKPSSGFSHSFVTPFFFSIMSFNISAEEDSDTEQILSDMLREFIEATVIEKEKADGTCTEQASKKEQSNVILDLLPHTYAHRKL
jgi:hypothetical protein